MANIIRKRKNKDKITWVFVVVVVVVFFLGGCSVVVIANLMGVMSQWLSVRHSSACSACSGFDLRAQL